MNNLVSFGNSFGKYSAFIGSGYGLTLLILALCLAAALIKRRKLRKQLDQRREPSS